MLPDSAALYGGSVTVYWHGLIFLAAICAAVIITQRLRLFQMKQYALAYGKRMKSKPRTGVGLACVAAFPLALLCGRAFYCAFAADSLELGRLAQGGYSLCGTMAGAVCGFAIAAFIKPGSAHALYSQTRNQAVGNELAQLLDAAAPGAALAIALGRMGSYFSHEDFGTNVLSEKWQFFPFACCFDDSGRWYVAVFCFEALTAVIALVVSLTLFWKTYRDGGVRCRKGDVFIAFLMTFSAFQIMMESMRTDSLRMRNNAFVRPSQIFWAVVLLTVVVLACVWNGKRFGLHGKALAELIAVVAGLGLIGFSEYRVIANKGSVTVNYIIMTCAAVVFVAAGLSLLMSTHTYNMEQKDR